LHTNNQQGFGAFPNQQAPPPQQGFGAFPNQQAPPPQQVTLSLTVITLTVCVIYTTVFESQNQVIFKMIVFGVGPSLSN
jgi:hypothetical protein